MRAAFYDGTGKMAVSDYPMPEIEDGEVLIDIKSTGICGSDLNMNKSKTAADDIPAGHEIAGTIIETGNGVSKQVIGQRVAVEVLGSGRACNECWYCRQGQYIHCPNSTKETRTNNREDSKSGGFSEYITRKLTGCYPILDTMSWSEGALVEPLAVSVHGLRTGQIKGGDNVAILGAGTIGLTAVAAAKKLGAGKIFVTAKHPQQAEMAKTLGADYTADPSDGSFEEMLLDMTNGRGADLTVETVGGSRNDSLIQSIEVTRKQGRIVILGVFYGDLAINWARPILKELNIQGSICYGLIDGVHDFEQSIEMFSDNDFNLSEIVTHSYDLENIQKGFETAYDKTTGSIKVHIMQK
jgi:threonine dehydrogenase-like Zn-dependent dehydrogenase